MSGPRSKVPSATSRRERGVSAVFVAITLVAVGGFLALALNVGHLMSVRAQLQNATDAGALAGAYSLDGTTAGLAPARAFAQEFAQRHATDRVPVVVDQNPANDPAGDIVLGHWNASQPRATAFTPVADPYATPGVVNAVLVRAGRESARGNPLDVFFSAFLGQTTASVRAEAIAIAGGPCEDCGVPLVFADCLLVDSNGNLKCGAPFTFNSATEDTIGFTNLTNESAVNPPTVIDILNGNCNSVQAGDSVGVSNGSNLTPAVIAAFKAYIDRNGPTITAPIVAPGTCPSPQFNQIQPIVGFGTFTITDIQGAPHPSLTMSLDCHIAPAPVPGGCEFFGTGAQARLAR